MHLFMLAITSLAQDVNYVKPNSSSSCSRHTNCQMLENYSTFSEMYFTTGATFKFLSGNHSLQDHTLMINRSANITLMKGDRIDSALNIILSNTSIQCYSVKNLTIVGLKFILRTNHIGSSAFAFDHSIGTFSDSKFLVISSQQIRAIKSLRSVINIRNCFFEGSQNFSARNFEGGAVCAKNSTIYFTGNNSFINNVAYLGGALYAYHTWIESEGNQRFLGNKAIQSGGGMYLSDSDLFCSKKIVQHFVKNEATL